MSLLALVLGLSIRADEPVWKEYRLDQSGMKIKLPEAPKERQLIDGLEFTLDYQSVKLKISASKKTPEEAQKLSAAYTEKFGQFSQQYGRKIKSILNESPVLEAYQFGATESIGFVLEVDADGGKVHAWQRVLIDGWEYDVSLDCSRKDQPLMEKILGSVMYVNPSTGDFKIENIGGMGLKSYLGIAFLPTKGESRPEARSLLLDSDNFPAMIVGTVWDRAEVIFEDPDQFKAALTKWLAGYVQGAKSELILTQHKTDRGLDYDLTGKVVIQGIELQIAGRALTNDQEARAVIAVIDHRTPGAMDFATKVLKSVQWVELERNH
ncbi:MAG: hypothetical protein KF824_13410 [Fimbriimonadaceae bacterium]|nr:MAG: hypothetical protein KF824_13410 [Fimbriimonadaceae bacterium]